MCFVWIPFVCARLGRLTGGAFEEVLLFLLGESVTFCEDAGEQIGNDGGITEGIESENGCEGIVHCTARDSVLPFLWYLEPVKDIHRDMCIVPFNEGFRALSHCTTYEVGKGTYPKLFSVIFLESHECVLHSLLLHQGA